VLVFVFRKLLKWRRHEAMPQIAVVLLVAGKKHYYIFLLSNNLVFRKSHIEYNGVRLFADKLHSAELWCIECTWFCLCVCIDRLRATLYIAVRLLFVRGCTTIYYSKSNQYTFIRPSGGNVLIVFERYNY